MADVTINGDGGNNSLSGGATNDLINGLGGNDTLNGNAGNDTILADVGNDTVFGGQGNDTLSAGAGNDQVSGDDGNDIITGGSGTQTLLGGNNDDIITPMTVFDTGAHSIDGGAGNDTVIVNALPAGQVWTGGSGNDTLDLSSLSAGVTVVLNTITGTVSFGGQTVDADSFETVIGTQSGDVLISSVVNSSLSGLGGADSLAGGSGNDTMEGGNGGDLLQGEAGNDRLFGGADNDFISAGDGVDSVDGGTGNDTITVIVDGVANTFSGGANTDTLSLATSTAAWILLGNSTGSSSASTISFSQIEVIIGSDFNDQISDASNVATILGGKGNDKITVDGTTSTSESFDGGEGIDTLETVLLIGATINFATGALSGHAGISGFEAVSAGNGNDVITGDNDAETFSAGFGDDTVFGGGGTDIIDGFNGNDRLDGGAGSDSIFGASGNDIFVISAGAGGDLLNGGSNTDTIDMTLIGTNWGISFGAMSTTDITLSVSEFEILLFGAGNDLALELTGVTSISAGAGNDIVSLDSTAEVGDSFDGGTGNDIINLANLPGATLNLGTGALAGHGNITGFETAFGSNGNDTLIGSGGADSLDGASGNDSIEGGAGHDTLDGGGGNDTVFGGSGNDRFIFNTQPNSDSLNAGADVDTLDFSNFNPGVVTQANSTFIISGATTSFTGFEIIIGTAKNDTLSDAPSVGTLLAGAGNDIVVVDATISATESFAGEAGIDTLRLTSLTNVVVNLGTGALSGHAGASGFEIVEAGSGNDTLTGGTTDDSLFGGGGRDSLSGGSGNDALVGGAANDTLDGNAGQDFFVFNTGLGASNVDRLSFVVADDTIRLENAIFTGLASGNLAGTAFVANVSGTATTINHRIVYDTDSGELFFDADGSGGTGRVLFATLKALPVLTAADFVVF